MAQKVRIVTAPHDIVTQTGKAVDLPCEVIGDVTSDPSYKFRWRIDRKNDLDVLIYQTPPSQLIDDVRYNVTGTYNLHIGYVGFSHAGIYSCGLQYMETPLNSTMVVIGETYYYTHVYYYPCYISSTTMCH